MVVIAAPVVVWDDTYIVMTFLFPEVNNCLLFFTCIFFQIFNFSLQIQSVSDQCFLQHSGKWDIPPTPRLPSPSLPGTYPSPPATCSSPDNSVRWAPEGEPQFPALSYISDSYLCEKYCSPFPRKSEWRQSRLFVSATLKCLSPFLMFERQLRGHRIFSCKSFFAAQNSFCALQVHVSSCVSGSAVLHNNLPRSFQHIQLIFQALQFYLCALIGFPFLPMCWALNEHFQVKNSTLH